MGRIVYAAAMSHVLHPDYYGQNVGPHGRRMVEELITVVRAMGPDWHAAAPDLRGHGHAADARPVTFETIRDDLDTVVAGGTEVLVGYSMGGRLALDWAVTRRGKIGRLVLVSASPGLADPDERAARKVDERVACPGVAAEDEGGTGRIGDSHPVGLGRVAHQPRLDRQRTDLHGLSVDPMADVEEGAEIVDLRTLRRRRRAEARPCLLRPVHQAALRRRRRMVAPPDEQPGEVETMVGVQV